MMSISEQILSLQYETANSIMNYTDLDRESIKFYTENTLFKTYPRFEKIKLPKPRKKEVNFFEVLENRASQRDWNETKQISINELSTIIHFSFGMKTEKKRFSPSAGGKYPNELYLHINRKIGKIKEGLYHYNIKDHSLEFMNIKLSKKELKELNTQEIIQKSGLILFITGCYKRSAGKYGAKAFRNIYLDCAHASQNLLLLSSALNLKSCPFAGFNFQKIEQEILDLNPAEEILLYMIGIGK